MNPKRILIADDCAVLVKALSNVLEAAGYQVLVAEDGAQAVSSIRRERPDVVLLDITFPPDVGHGGGVAWDGFGIMSWIRRIEEVKDIPIVIVSASEPAKYKARALAAGAVDYFQKPIDPDQLVATLRQILGENNADPQAQAEPSAVTDESSHMVGL